MHYTLTPLNRHHNTDECKKNRKAEWANHMCVHAYAV